MSHNRCEIVEPLIMIIGVQNCAGSQIISGMLRMLVCNLFALAKFKFPVLRLELNDALTDIVVHL